MACHPVFTQTDIEAALDESLPSMVFPDETADKDYPEKFDLGNRK
jgi:hypothetical protein